ncbi:MAG: copper chaperone PCu(A)C [Anaerolineales bacterium]
MKKFLIPIFAGLFLLGAPLLKDKDGDYSKYQSILTDICGITSTDDVMTGLRATDNWVGSALRGNDSDAYMILHNRYDEDDALIGASTDVASSVEIHINQTTIDGSNTMIAQNLIVIPAQKIIEFAPGGIHLMLISLKQDLIAGNDITITLHFQKHEDLIVNFPIKNW